MNCCAKCFGDRHLKREIIPNNPFQEIGDCSYCPARNITVVPPAELAQYFELLIDAYQPDANGKLLVIWFREDWGMFPDLDNAHAKELLAEILDDGERVRQTFSPIIAVNADRLSECNKIRYELIYHNRFFPKT